MFTELQKISPVHLGSGSLRKPSQNIIESTSKKGPCSLIARNFSMYPTFGFYFIFDLCIIFLHFQIELQYQLYIKSHKYTFTAMALSNNTDKKILGNFNYSSFKHGHVAFKPPYEIGDVMFAKVHKICWYIQYDLDLDHDSCITPASSACTSAYRCVCECIAFSFTFLNSPFDMKVTKELHLLSLGQRVCILLYAYEI